MSAYEDGVAYIVDACRTAGGKKNGRLSHWHPVDLGAQVINALLDRNQIKDGSVVDDVIVGCVSQVGAQAGNIGRYIVLASKLPESVPGTAVDRQCGSSQQAIHFAAQAVMSGVQDVVIAAGVESMTNVPMGSSVQDSLEHGRGTPMSANIQKRYPETPMFSQFDGGELMAVKWGVTREECDHLGVVSQQRAAAATAAGYFKKEIVPVEGIDPKTKQKSLHTVDEGIRPTTAEAVKQLKTLREGGRITAATASQICDGAAAVLICNAKGLKKLGLTPRAKIVSLALAGTDPVVMLAGPIPATRTALQKAKLSIKDIDLYEVNEAFAPVPLGWLKDIGADFNKLNVNGGAIALGHPLGASGCKLMTTLLHELERRNGRYGLQAICEGGGTANATIIERIPPIQLPYTKAKL